MQRTIRCGLLLTLAAGSAAFAQDDSLKPPTNVLANVTKVPGQRQASLNDFPEATGNNVPKFPVRPGYKVTLAAEGLTEARFMVFDDKGTLYLSQPDRRKGITALRDTNNDGVYETKTQYVSNYQSAHGLCFHNGWLWFATSSGVHKTRDTNSDGVADEIVAILPEGTLPKGGHWWKGLLVSDDGFYVSIGDAGNINDELNNSDRQKLWFYSSDGKTRKLWSSGLRNTEKLRFRPGTKEVWGSDHGSDNIGGRWGESKEKGQPFTDNYPPEEFNRYDEGAFYGHPFIVGNRIPRPEFLDRPDIVELAAKTTPPAWNFGAHWAGNGFTFITKDYFPGHKGDVFEAFHGSWNSSSKVGYRIERLMFDSITGMPVGSQLIISTLGKNGDQLDRPNDCVEAPDGTILFSCDSGRIFRISKAQ